MAARTAPSPRMRLLPDPAFDAEVLAPLWKGPEGGPPRADVLHHDGEQLMARARLLQEEPSLRSFLRLASEMTVRFGPGSEFAASYEVPVAAFAELISRGQQQGVVNPQLDPQQAGAALFAALLGADEMSRVISSGADLEERTAGWLDVMIRGLAAQR